jgi:aminoglycoside 3-N-acetyltransferase
MTPLDELTSLAMTPLAPGTAARDQHHQGGPHHQLGLTADLARLGVGEGDVVLVHSSLRSLGFVIGGAVSVVRALLQTVGPRGTVVVPAFSSDNGDPSRWALTRKSPVPSPWWPTIRKHLPAFDPAVTPSVAIGAIAEAVRTWPGAVRSLHPQTSFVALGARAGELMAEHHPDCHLGPHSPLAALARAEAKVLLLGVPFTVCTTFHLAEYQVHNPPRRDYECVIQVDGERRWYHFRDVRLDASDFDRLGAAFESSPAGGVISRGCVGDAECRLFPLPNAVTFARAWLVEHRDNDGDTPLSDVARSDSPDRLER